MPELNERVSDERLAEMRKHYASSAYMLGKDVLGVIAELQQRRAAADDTHRCFICQQPFQAGQMVLPDVNEGLGHRECFGEDREAYVKDTDTGEPPGPDDPIPAGEPYDPADYAKPQRRASVVSPEMVEAAARAMCRNQYLAGHAEAAVGSIVDARWKSFSSDARAALTAALSVVSHETGDGEPKATHTCTCWACSGAPAPTDETQGVKRDDEERLPTRAEAAHAAAVLIRCNGHDLDVWTDGEWPSNTDFLDTLVHNHDQ